MKPTFFFIIFLILNGTISLGQRRFSSNEVKADIQFLKHRFDTMHPGMYFYTSKSQYDSLYHALYANAKDNMTFQEVLRYISPLITEMKDGHTSFSSSKKNTKNKPVLPPIYIREIDNKIYLHYNGSQDSTLQRGVEIIALNDEPIERVLHNLQTTFGTDNDNIISKKFYATRLFSTFYYKYYGETDSLKLDYKKSSDDTLHTVKLANLKNSESLKIIVKRYKNALRKNFAYSILDSNSRTAQLAITSFSMKKNFLDFPQFKFKKMLKKRFKSIEKDSIEHLIVDFRGNGGGFIPNIPRFLSYVAPQPFVLMDTVFFRKKAFRKVAPIFTIIPPLVTHLLYKPSNSDYYFRKPSKPITYRPTKKFFYDKKIYFLMDGGSYSATTFTLGLAKDMGIGTFIGEQAGGANWGSFAATWNNFLLPNSKIRIHMPLYKLMHNLPNHRTTTLFLEPDYDVGYNFSDFIHRKDSVLEFTLNLIAHGLKRGL